MGSEFNITGYLQPFGGWYRGILVRDDTGQELESYFSKNRDDVIAWMEAVTDAIFHPDDYINKTEIIKYIRKDSSA